MLPFCYQGNAILNNPRENLYVHIFSLCVAECPLFTTPYALPQYMATLCIYKGTCTEVHVRIVHIFGKWKKESQQESSQTDQKGGGEEDGMIRKTWTKGGGQGARIFCVCVWRLRDSNPLAPAEKTTTPPPQGLCWTFVRRREQREYPECWVFVIWLP